MPKISIIMGAYNCQDTVCESIDSILAQTFTDWEFIICDDASTDETLMVLNRYKTNYPDKFVILHNENNMMLAGSLNRCLKVAKGKYIARMDADDLSEPTRLQKQYDYLENNPNMDLVGTFMQGFDDEGLKDIVPIKIDPVDVDLPKANPFHHATIMMKKSVYDELNGYTVSKRTRRVEDVDLWFRFFSKGFKGHTISEPLYLVRIDEGAYKRRKIRYSFDASMVLFNGIKLLGLSPKYYIYTLKPIISQFIPKKLKIYYRIYKHGDNQSD